MITNQKSLGYIKILTDLLFLSGSFIIAATLSQSLQTLIERPQMFVLLLLQNLLWYFTTKSTNFYDEFSSRYLAGTFVELLKNTFAQTALSIVFIFVIKENLFTRNFIILYTAILFVSVFSRATILKKIFSTVRKQSGNIRNIIIIGASDAGNKFLNLLENNPDFGYNFIGFVDDSLNAADKNILGKLDELEKLIHTNKIEEAIITLPNSEYNQLEDIIYTCNKNAVRVHIIPDYFKFISKKFRISLLGDLPVITVRNEPLEEIHWKILKRTFDIIVSILVIVLVVSWLFPLIIIIQKLTSKGPAFFVQDRIGKGNQPFKCFKFRTMTTTTWTKFIPTSKNDPRVTKFGKFLRRSNLDELPQIFNVLIGNMSLVGPRPHPIPYNNMYKEIVDELRLRHLVKPGITGWAQIHGLRGDVQDEEENKNRIRKRVEYDIWYIENWSFWLDIEIILLTVWQMIKADTKGF